jgi:hypothetical protein
MVNGGLAKHVASGGELGRRNSSGEMGNDLNSIDDFFPQDYVLIGGPPPYGEDDPTPDEHRTLVEHFKGHLG